MLNTFQVHVNIFQVQFEYVLNKFWTFFVLWTFLVPLVSMYLFFLNGDFFLHFNEHFNLTYFTSYSCIKMLEFRTRASPSRPAHQRHCSQSLYYSEQLYCSGRLFSIFQLVIILKREYFENCEQFFKFKHFIENYEHFSWNWEHFFESCEQF